eukprot:scaffold85134_cov51-Attheya_sp.AAC.9
MAGVQTNRMASHRQRPCALAVMIVMVLGMAALGVSLVSAKPSVSALRGVPRVVQVSSHDSSSHTNANEQHRERQLSKDNKKKDKSKGGNKKDKQKSKKNKSKDDKKKNKLGKNENISSGNKAPQQQKDSAPDKASTEIDKDQNKPDVPVEIAEPQTAKKDLPKQPIGEDQAPKEEPTATAAPPDQKVAPSNKANTAPIDAPKEESPKVNAIDAQQNGPEMPEKPNTAPIDAPKEESPKVNAIDAKQNGPETPEKPSTAPIDAPKEESPKVNDIDAKQNGPETPEKPSTAPIDAPKEESPKVNAIDAKQNGPETPSKGLDEKAQGKEITTPNSEVEQATESVATEEASPNETQGGEIPVVATDTAPSELEKSKRDDVITDATEPTKDDEKAPDNDTEAPITPQETSPDLPKVNENVPVEGVVEEDKSNGVVQDTTSESDSKLETGKEEDANEEIKSVDSDDKNAAETSAKAKLSQDVDQIVRNDTETEAKVKSISIDETNPSKTAKKSEEEQKEVENSEANTKDESETAEEDDEGDGDEDDSETDVTSSQKDEDKNEGKEIISTCESATLCSECVGDVAAAVETHSNSEQTCTWIDVLAEKGEGGFKCTAVTKTDSFENVKCTDDTSSPSSVGSESRGSSEEGGGSSFRAFYILIMFAGAGAYARNKMLGQNMFLDRRSSSGPSDTGSQSQRERGQYQEIAPLSNNSDDWGWEDEASGVDMELPPTSSFHSHRSVENEEEDLEMALAMSLSESPGKSTTLPTPIPTSRAIPKRTTSSGSGTGSSNSRINAATSTNSSSTHSSGSVAKPNPPPTRITSLAKPNPPPTRITSLGKKLAPSAAKKIEKPPQEDDIFASMGLSAKPNFAAAPRTGGSVPGTFAAKASPPVSGSSWRSAVQASPAPVISAYSATTGMEDLGSDEGSNWDDDSDLDDLLDD